MRARLEALLLSLLALWGLWGAEFYALLQNQTLTSASAILNLASTALVSLVLSVIGGLLCLYWPSEQYIVKLTQESEASKMREIRVRLPSGEIMTRQAHFFTVSVGVPAGTENAEEIRWLFKHPTSNDLFELQKIQSTGVPYIFVQWAGPDKFPSEVPEQFATALLDAKEGKIEHLNLVSGEEHVTLVTLVLFFTVSGADAVYFTSTYRRAYVMPFKFQTELYIEAKDRKQKLLATLEIDARRWDYVSVEEPSNRTNLFQSVRAFLAKLSHARNLE